MARKKATTIDLTAQAVSLAEFGAKALTAAEELRIKTKPIKDFPLDNAEQVFAAELPGVSAALKKKLKGNVGKITIADAASVLTAAAESLLEGEPMRQVALIFMAKKLMDCLQANVTSAASTKLTSIAVVYQFKITLLEVKPSIWRRIQVQDCTLDKLHEHIQTAMGWTNSHLHQFEINGKRCGDPELLDDDFDPFQGVDSTKALLSRILPENGERFAFKYDYDFGDYWEHEVLFEGLPPIVPKAKYPMCLEGERACPPEDCGGTSGFSDFLEVIRNPKHEEHESMLEWIGGRFDSEAFDAKRATKAMKKGLPDWRRKK